MPDRGALHTDIAVEDRRWTPLELTQGMLLFFLALTLGFAPRAIPVLLCVSACVALVEARRSGWLDQELAARLLRAPGSVTILAFLAFALLSSAWSGDPGLGVSTVLQQLAVILATVVLAILLPRQISDLPPTRRKRLVRAIPIGVIVSCLYLVIELAAKAPLTLAAVRWTPGLAGVSPKDLSISGDQVIGILQHYFNRNIAAIGLAMPGVVFATLAWLPGQRGRGTAAALVGAACVAIVLSGSEASKLGLVAALVALIAGCARFAGTLRAIQALAVAGFLLAVPLGRLPSQLGLETAPWVDHSVRERAMIWDRTASAIARSPLIGIGVQSTRQQQPPFAGAPRELGWHAHNFVLQVWLELGAIGAMLLLAHVLVLLSAVGRLSAGVRAAALATCAAGLAIAVTGWGLWQPWLIAAMGTALVGLSISEAAAASRSQPSAPEPSSAQPATT